jgi:hypothetical protein
MKITRRKLAAAVIAPAALMAQPQTPPPIPANAEEELTAVREQNRRNAHALDGVKIPMATEPAFTFKA